MTGTPATAPAQVSGRQLQKQRKARKERLWHNRYKRIPKSGRRWLLKLGRCETRGYKRAESYKAHNPSGKYHGRYQFDLRTAREAGFRGDPHRALPREVDVRTYRFMRKVGTGRWPSCG